MTEVIYKPSPELLLWFWMPRRNTSRLKGKARRKTANWPARNTAGRKAKPHYSSRKKPNPDIHVKKATYSKTARLAVLASAGARQRLIEMGGENTIDVIREFDQDMSDEELARKTGIKASDVRVVLNRLHGCGLFSYTRVRDRDSGWYSYIWKMSESRLRDFVGGGFVEDMMEEGAVQEDDYSQKNMQGEQTFVERKRR